MTITWGGNPTIRIRKLCVGCHLGLAMLRKRRTFQRDEIRRFVSEKHKWTCRKRARPTKWTRFWSSLKSRLSWTAKQLSALRSIERADCEPATKRSSRAHEFIVDNQFVRWLFRCDKVSRVVRGPRCSERTSIGRVGCSATHKVRKVTRHPVGHFGIRTRASCASPKSVHREIAASSSPCRAGSTLGIRVGWGRKMVRSNIKWMPVAIRLPAKLS